MVKIVMIRVTRKRRRMVVILTGPGRGQSCVGDQRLEARAWNTTLAEVNQCVLYSVLTANICLEGATGKAILPAVLKNINKLSQLLMKYSKSKSGQQYYFEGVEGIVTRHEIYLDIMPKILQVLYDKDILSDDNIFAWNKKLLVSSKNDPVLAKLSSKMKPFIAWLEESDDEDESDSD